MSPCLIHHGSLTPTARRIGLPAGTPRTGPDPAGTLCRGTADEVNRTGLSMIPATCSSAATPSVRAPPFHTAYRELCAAGPVTARVAGFAAAGWPASATGQSAESALIVT